MSPAAAVTVEPTPAGRWLLLFLGLALASGLLYGQTLAFGYTNCDDLTQISRDAEFLQDPRNALKVFNRPDHKQEVGSGMSEFYRPVVTLSYMADAFPSGPVPYRYHLGNLFAHVLASWLLVLFLVQLGHRFRLAAILGLVFSLHPGLTEAVAWIPGRTDILLGIAFLASFICFLRYQRDGGTAWLLGHAVAFLAGLFTKETALVIPLVAISYVLLVERDWKGLLKPALWLAWFTAGLVWLVLWKTYSIKAQDLSLGQYLHALFANAPVLLMHLGKIFWPWQLSGLAVSRNTPWVPGLVAAVTLGLGWPWLKLKQPSLYAWGLVAFVLFLAITLPVSDFLILEPRLYAPVMCLLVVLAEVFRSRELPSRMVVGKPLARVALTFVCALLAVRSYVYSSDFRNEETFTAAAVVNSPDSSSAHLARGIWLQNNNREDLAIQHYVRSIRILPAQQVCRNNLGVIFMRHGRLDTAEKFFLKEIEVNPNYDVAHFNLGLVYKTLGRREDALRSWREAVRLNPRHNGAIKELKGHQG